MYKVTVILYVFIAPHCRFSDPDDLGKGIIKTNKDESNEYTILLIGECYNQYYSTNS